MDLEKAVSARCSLSVELQNLRIRRDQLVFSYLTIEETEAQRREVTFPGSYSKELM